MQIVIDIKEEDYRFIHEHKFVPEVCILSLGRSIYNGIPLPKGHGRIVDIDKLIHYKCNECGNDINCSLPCYAVRRMLDAPIIIEADKEIEE